MKIVLVGPIKTLSGYGALTRDTYRYLDSLQIHAKQITTREAEIEFDYREYDPELEYDIAIYCFTPVDIYGDKMVRHWLSDVKAKKTVLLTAGIESDKTTSVWNEVTNQYFDAIIASTEHSKKGFLNQQQPSIEPPIYVVTEGVDLKTFYREETDDFKFSTPINFLTSGQVGLGDVGEDRKQIWQLVKDFLDVFDGREDVGLVLKIWMGGYNSYEREHLVTMLKRMKGSRKGPAIHLLYGALNRDQLRRLYSTSSIKGYISLSSGEGFGRGFIEAAACKTPIVGILETGQKDFLLKDCIFPVEAKLRQTSRAYISIVPYFMAEDSKWWYSKSESVKEQLLRLASTSREDLEERLQVQYQFLVDNHSEEVAARKLIKVLEIINNEEDK